MASALHEKAKTIADRLAERVPAVEGVRLFGSVARGDTEESSDIDLLVVGSDPSLTPVDLLEKLPEPLRAAPLSLLYYSAAELEDLYEQGDLFVLHILTEGQTLLDRADVFDRLRHEPRDLRLTIRAGLELELSRLRPYEDLTRFNDNFLFCLSHLYAIAKSVVMLDLAKEGILEFNRAKAFKALRDLHPEHAEELDRLSSLEPFYRLVTGRRREALPFSYIGARRETESAIRAIRTLAEVGLDDGE